MKEPSLRHKLALPDHVEPIPIPETPGEALWLYLEMEYVCGVEEEDSPTQEQAVL